MGSRIYLAAPFFAVLAKLMSSETQTQSILLFFSYFVHGGIGYTFANSIISYVQLAKKYREYSIVYCNFVFALNLSMSNEYTYLILYDNCWCFIAQKSQNKFKQAWAE